MTKPGNRYYLLLYLHKAFPYSQNLNSQNWIYKTDPSESNYYGDTWNGDTDNNYLIYLDGDDRIDGDAGEDTLSINASLSDISYVTNSIGVTYLTRGDDNLIITDVEKVATIHGGSIAP